MQSGPCRGVTTRARRPIRSPGHRVGIEPAARLPERHQPEVDHPQLRDPGVQRVCAPEGATPVRVSWCRLRSLLGGQPHPWPPLAFGSCAPPADSAQLTVGTPDANGQAAAPRLPATGGVWATRTPADEADVTRAEPHRRAGRGHARRLRGSFRRFDVRLTDGASGPAQSEAATVSDLSFPITVPCTPTGAAGGRLPVATSFDAVVPGSVQERTLDLGPGPDRGARRRGALFARQGSSSRNEYLAVRRHLIMGLAERSARKV